MIRLSLLLTLCLLANLSNARTGSSQYPLSDTTHPIQDSTLRKLMTAAEQRNILAERIALQNERITTLEQLIIQYKGKDSLTTAYWSGQLFAMRTERDLAMQTVSSLNKQLRRARTGKRIAGLTGIAATGLAIWLSVKK